MNTNVNEIDAAVAKVASDVLDKENGRLADMLEKREGDILLNPGAFLSLRGKGGTTLLHLAAAEGNMRVVTALLDAGMSPDVASDCGVTPLMVAAAVQSEAVINILEDRGANRGAVSALGLSPQSYFTLGGLLPSKVEKW